MTTGFLVCVSTGYFADDVKTTCAECGAAIVYRPHASADLIKICTRCAVAKGGPRRVDVTDETVREVDLYFAKTKGTQ